MPASPGLRPSGDRVRETLFNWLMPVLAGARVVDVFAGTGALGLEAVSRGAAHAVLVERDAALARSLRETVARLSAQESVEVAQGDALAWLARQAAASFDVAFVDPPFDAGPVATDPGRVAAETGAGCMAVPGIPARTGADAAARSGHCIAKDAPARCAMPCTGAPDLRGADTLNGNISVAVPE